MRDGGYSGDGYAGAGGRFGRRGGRRPWAAMLALGLLVLLPACMPAGAGKPVPEGEERMDLYHKECLAGGGDYIRSGKGKNFICEGLPKDAGKYCAASTDCVGACLARSHSCAPVAPLLGCNEVLDSQGRTVTECID